MKIHWWARLWSTGKSEPREKHLPLSGEQCMALALSSAALGVQNAIQRHLKGYYIDDSQFLQFMPEFYCYILHLLELELSGTPAANDKGLVTARLIGELAQEQRILGWEWGCPAGNYKQELEDLREKFQERQVEYARLGQTGREKVAARFADYAVEALDVDGDLQNAVAQRCAVLAAEAFAELLPRLLQFADTVRSKP